MATRVGIELSPTACRIVEVDAGAPWRPATGETRVRSFSILPASGSETRAKLESLRRREASVVVWGGRSEHRQVMVTSGSYEAMRAEAMASLTAAGLPTIGMWTDIAPASPPDDLAPRRPVVVAMASSAEMADALHTIRDAGIRLKTVTTPAVALGSLARMRRDFSVPGAIEAYVALDAQATCVALVRGGVLLAGRELAWGFVDANYARTALRSREDITARLADAIGGFVAEIGGEPKDLGQVCVCGGLPELRSMSAALMECLDVEVEPFDSLFGIDAARLPEPPDAFRDGAAELRLAWAAAADWTPAINLLRARRRQVSKAWLGRAAVIAGAAVGVGGSWWAVERSRLLPTPSAPTVSNGAARGRGPAVAASKPPAVTRSVLAANKPPVVPMVATSKPPIAPPPMVATSKPPIVSPPPIVATSKPPTTAPSVAAAGKPPIASPSVAAASEPPVGAPQTMAARKPPVVTPVPTKPTVLRPPPVVVPPIATAGKAPAGPPPVVVPPPVEAPPVAIVNQAASEGEPSAARSRPAPTEIPLPFDAALGTILYSADRRLAIIDNRIVGVGDEVKGARITEITPGTVLLRDAQGRLRKLTLGAAGR